VCLLELIGQFLPPVTTSIHTKIRNIALSNNNNIRRLQNKDKITNLNNKLKQQTSRTKTLLIFILSMVISKFELIQTKGDLVKL
jgi:hypothetical protein